MSKIYFYLLLLLAIIFYSPLQAQDTIKHNRNEIAIDVSPVFAGLVSRNSVPGITYRRHYEKGAFRARLNFSGSNIEERNISSSINNNVPTREIKSADFSLRVGYQWHKDYNKLRWYYGLDAIATYGEDSNLFVSTTIYDPNAPNYINSNQTKSTSRSVGISPIVGLSYRINSRFSISVESALTLRRIYGKNKNTSKYTSQSNGQIQSEYTYSNKHTGTDYSFIPMNGLLVSYHF